MHSEQIIKIEEWEKKFDEEFDQRKIVGERIFKDYCPYLIEDIKQFIHKAIQEERTKILNLQKSCDNVFEEYIQPYVDKKVQEERAKWEKNITVRDVYAFEAGQKDERDRCKKIVNDETPKHFTRDYKETDSMRDRIINKINPK
jgi:hypothetical protein